MTRNIKIHTAPSKCCWYKNYVGQEFKCFLDGKFWRIENNPLFAIPMEHSIVVDQNSTKTKSEIIYEEFINTAKEIEAKYGYFTARKVQDKLNKQVDHQMRKAKKDNLITGIDGTYNFK